MKNYIMILAFSFLTSLFLYSCSKEENKGSAPIALKDIKTLVDFGSVKFVWPELDAVTILYTQIEYINDSGKSVVEKFSTFNDTAVISNLNAREYEFYISQVSHTGVLSEKSVFKATPYAPPYQLVAQTVVGQPTFGGVKFSWENPSKQAVAINVSYQNAEGQQVRALSSNSLKDSVVISGLSDGMTVFSLLVKDGSGNSAPLAKFEFTPLQENRIDKSKWSIKASSQEEDTGEGAINGWAAAAIDNDVNSFWHSEWKQSSPDYPHWLQIDLGNNAIVSRVELIGRQNKNDSFTDFVIEGSLDQANWVEFGAFKMQAQNGAQNFALAQTPSMRYLRITMKKGASNYAHLAEISIFGQEN